MKRVPWYVESQRTNQTPFHRLFPVGHFAMTRDDLLARITSDPGIFGGKPIIRGHRLAVEHVLGLLAAGDRPEAILDAYPWLEPEDIQACLTYAQRIVAREPIELQTGTTPQ